MRTVDYMDLNVITDHKLGDKYTWTWYVIALVLWVEDETQARWIESSRRGSDMSDLTVVLLIISFLILIIILSTLDINHS